MVPWTLTNMNFVLYLSLWRAILDTYTQTPSLTIGEAGTATAGVGITERVGAGANAMTYSETGTVSI